MKFFKYLNKDFGVPNRKIINKILIDDFDKKIISAIEALSKNNSKFSITADGWTSPVSESFLGITAHYIEDDFIMRSIVLDILPFDHPHDGESIAEIAEAIYKVLGEWGVIGNFLLSRWRMVPIS